MCKVTVHSSGGKVTVHLLFPMTGVVGVSRLYWGAVGAGTPDGLVSPTDGRFIPIILPAHPTIIWNGQLLLDSGRDMHVVRKVST